MPIRGTLAGCVSAGTGAERSRRATTMVSLPVIGLSVNPSRVGLLNQPMVHRNCPSNLRERASRHGRARALPVSRPPTFDHPPRRLRPIPERRLPAGVLPGATDDDHADVFGLP